MDADCRATVYHKSMEQTTYFFSNHTGKASAASEANALKLDAEIEKCAFEEAAEH